MPNLEDEIIKDLTARAKCFLTATGCLEEDNFEFCDAGASAAVYRFVRNGMPRALKVFNPQLFSGSKGDAERRRLRVQKRLIGHGCPSLAQTHLVEEKEGTAFIEMEFIEWPQLKKKLVEVPDEAIEPLISQLVDAVKFLSSLNIVHRDIKPENIHVSPDFKRLKLLDFGVVREFDSSDANNACVTDHGNQRPFLATAQYSSPEYLFRLDEPTATLWRGLNIYQVGAVLHDLIEKKPLFNDEISLGNRWLVAKAVLTKQPSFSDHNPDRLIALKNLALRCLTKDLNTRLEIVGWEDFMLEGASDPVRALQGKLAKRSTSVSDNAGASSEARLAFERREFMKRFSDRIREELIHSCSTQLPLAMKSPAPDEQTHYLYELAASNQWCINCLLRFDWQTGLYVRNANLYVGAQIVGVEQGDVTADIMCKLVGVAKIQEAEEEVLTLVTHEMARLISEALDQIDSKDVSKHLHGANIQHTPANHSTHSGPEPNCA